MNTFCYEFNGFLQEDMPDDYLEQPLRFLPDNKIELENGDILTDILSDGRYYRDENGFTWCPFNLVEVKYNPQEQDYEVVEIQENKGFLMLND